MYIYTHTHTHTLEESSVFPTETTSLSSPGKSEYITQRRTSRCADDFTDATKNILLYVYIYKTSTKTPLNNNCIYKWKKREYKRLVCVRPHEKIYPILFICTVKKRELAITSTCVAIHTLMLFHALYMDWKRDKQVNSGLGEKEKKKLRRFFWYANLFRKDDNKSNMKNRIDEMQQTTIHLNPSSFPCFLQCYDGASFKQKR